MGLGGGNPLAFKLGGGPSPSQRVNNALKVAVGDGGSAIDGTLEAEWRKAKAAGWASSLSDARAMYQTWPDTAEESGVEVFERILGINPPGDATLQDRRNTATTQWVRISSSANPDITSDLQNIDPSIILLFLNDRASFTTTVPGRAFEDAILSSPDANGPKFFIVSQAKFTVAPNFSHDFVMFVSFPNPPGPLPKAQLTKLFAIADLLDAALPSWCRFQINTKLDPNGCFILDLDLLDTTPLCP